MQRPYGLALVWVIVKCARDCKDPLGRINTRITDRQQGDSMVVVTTAMGHLVEQLLPHDHKKGSPLQWVRVKEVQFLRELFLPEVLTIWACLAPGLELC